MTTPHNIVDDNNVRNYSFGNGGAKNLFAGVHSTTGRFIGITAVGDVSFKGQGAGGDDDFSDDGTYAGNPVAFSELSTGMVMGAFDEVTVTGTGFLRVIEKL